MHLFRVLLAVHRFLSMAGQHVHGAEGPSAQTPRDVRGDAPARLRLLMRPPARQSVKLLTSGISTALVQLLLLLVNFRVQSLALVVVRYPVRVALVEVELVLVPRARLVVVGKVDDGNVAPRREFLLLEVVVNAVVGLERVLGFWGQDVGRGRLQDGLGWDRVSWYG